MNSHDPNMSVPIARTYQNLRQYLYRIRVRLTSRVQIIVITLWLTFAIKSKKKPYTQLVILFGCSLLRYGVYQSQICVFFCNIPINVKYMVVICFQCYTIKIRIYLFKKPHLSKRFAFFAHKKCQLSMKCISGRCIEQN